MDQAIVYEVLNLIRGIWKGVEKEWQAAARKVGLTPPQQHILWTLYFREGISISTLAERTLMHITTTTDIVKRMEKRGLVRIEACPNDGRAYSVFLTEAGRKKWAETLENQEGWRFLAAVCSLPEQERQLLLNSLRDWASFFHSDNYVQWVKHSAQRLESRVESTAR